MRITKALLLTGAASIALAASNHSLAAASSAEAAKLGAELTPFGAERAGNADGSIPAWTGEGVKIKPAGYQPGGELPDPYANEQQILTITAANYKEHAELLTEGAKALFEKYPDTFKMPIFKSHRDFTAPQWIYDNTAKNAVNANTTQGGNGIAGAFGGVPFPIPEKGVDVIWNHNLRWTGEGNYKEINSYTVFQNGQINYSGAVGWETYPYFKEEGKIEDFNDIFFQLMVQYDLPTRRKGEVILIKDPMNQAENPRQAWQYIPGQRRVRRAPTVAFDTPNTQLNGQATFDDTFMFNGSPERYDWKLVGKQEMYIPYNNYKFVSETMKDKSAFIMPGHPKPELERWEKHRVWVVEGTLKDGQRHIYGKRRFYVDEDSWLIVANDTFDGRGQLWRVGFAHVLPVYDKDVTLIRGLWSADLLNGAYSMNEVDRVPVKLYKGEKNKYFTPQSVRKLSRR